MNPFSIVILSKRMAALGGCIQALRCQGVQNERIIVVWDGDAGTYPFGNIPNAELAIGEQPFVFARNSNIGIRAAGSDDVILLNDDALIQTPEGFTHMQLAAHDNPQLGVLSALILGMAAARDQVATPLAIQRGENSRHVDPCRHHMLAFMCVYLRRSVLDEIGEFDERFVGYGYEDDDYCRRLTLAGYDLGVACGCLVEHGSVESTFRGQGRAAASDMLAENRELFNAKWREV